MEYLQNPTGIDSESPRFGWQLTSSGNGTYQSAYQIKVTNAGQEVWNSGKQVSNKSQLIPYRGKMLSPANRYTYQVKVWDQKDQVSEPNSSWFETAPSELSTKWIGAIRRENANLPQGRNWHSPSLKKNRAFFDSIPELAKRSIQLRKEVGLSEKPVKATAYISGLGHYEFNLNGERIGESIFAPLWTDYDKSIFYNTFDLTDQLNLGANAIGVLLGNGMYNVIGDRYRKFWISFGPPTLFFELRLEYQDGRTETIKSDKTWKYSLSPITFNDIFGGESYDARLEQSGWEETDFDDSSWQTVVIQDAPKGTLKAQLAPAVEVQRSFDVKEWKKVDSSTYLFDMGQNLAGFPSIKIQGKSGQKVKLTVGERVDEKGFVNQKNTGSPYYFEYTLSGDGVEEWQPKFSYYGYQYIQVEGISYEENVKNGYPELLDLKSNFIYSNADVIGSFECSNEIFSKTHTIINNAIKSNMQAVFTDCPHREKLGWLEEIHLNGPGLLYNYDLTQLLRKEMMDMKDAQRANGMVPNIAPEYVDFSAESWGADFTDSPEWGAAAVIVPWQYYEFYGDSSLIKENYEVMRRFVDYLTTRAEDGIVSHGLGDWYDYGEHGAGYSKNSPIALSATSHYFFCIVGLVKAAEMTGNLGDLDKYKSLKQEVFQAYNQEFFNTETNQYASGSQYSNAVSLYMGLVNEENKKAVLDNLVADIESHGNRLTTGDVGNRYLFQVLADNGLNDLLYDMLNHYEAPGYGYQLQYGLTTLTEQWDPSKGNSWNHFMMGQIEEWFFKSLAGIRSDNENPGFQKFIIEPKLAGDLTYVKASTKSLYGDISLHWKITDGQWVIDLDIPVNSSATFILPKEVESNERQLNLTSGHHSLKYKVKT
ncbi:MAG: family 78 glycoside hydrolase catalytic domain [Cyclobacteriaceae bacterium]